MIKPLSFSNQFFQAAFIEKENRLEIKNYGILLNLGEQGLKTDSSGAILPYKSYLLRNTEIKQFMDRAILVSFDFDPTKNNPDLNRFCASSWDSNKIRYPHDPTKWKFKILRSPIEKIGDLEINCWFLPGANSSSIHREHPFKEVHVQIYGLGIMNKFTDQNYDTLYQRMYMPPGFTHDFFFDKDVKYPWHQYEAVSNSIWMAFME